jgi:hypothetical protein
MKTILAKCLLIVLFIVFLYCNLTPAALIFNWYGFATSYVSLINQQLLITSLTLCSYTAMYATIGFKSIIYNVPNFQTGYGTIDVIKINYGRPVTKCSEMVIILFPTVQSIEL